MLTCLIEIHIRQLKAIWYGIKEEKVIFFSYVVIYGWGLMVVEGDLAGVFGLRGGDAGND